MEGILWKTEEAANGTRGLFSRLSDKQDHCESISYSLMLMFFFNNHPGLLAVYTLTDWHLKLPYPKIDLLFQ